MLEYLFVSLKHLPLIEIIKAMLPMAWDATACHLGMNCKLDKMTLARFNVFWYVWALAPLVIMSFSCWAPTRKKLWLGVLTSIVSVYVLSIFAVSRKWDLRLALASTPQESEFATADGANMVFTAYFFAPLEAIFLTLFWGAFVYLAGKVYRVMRNISFQGAR